MYRYFSLLPGMIGQCSANERLKSLKEYCQNHKKLDTGQGMALRQLVDVSGVLLIEVSLVNQVTVWLHVMLILFEQS